MRCYVVEWYTSPEGQKVQEYYKNELAAMNRQKEVENWARILGVQLFVFPIIKEILINE